MRILQLISSLGFYGAENVLLNLAVELKEMGFDPVAGVLLNKHNPHLEVAEIAAKKGVMASFFPCNSRFDARTFRHLRQFLLTNKIDLVHSHNYKSNFYALCATIGLNVGLITTCHNWPDKSPKMRFYTGLDKLMLRGFGAVVSVSQTVTQEIVSSGIPGRNITLIPNGIDTGKFNERFDSKSIKRDLGIQNGAKVVGTVGRLTPEKGHIHLLEAARLVRRTHPEIVFLIIGDGPLMEELKNKSKESGAVFTGVQYNLPAFYDMMDIFVLPSLIEGMPMVLLEAMASGTPVVASKVGGIPNLVTNGKTGLLVDAGDAEALAESLRFLLENPAAAQIMAEGGRKYVTEYFSASLMARSYLDVYFRILKAKGSKCYAAHVA